MSIPASLAQPSRPSLKLYTAKRSAKSKATLTFHKKHSLFLCRASPNRRKIEGGSQSAVGFGKDLKKRSGSSNDQTNGERIETSHEADETSQIENSVDTGESVRSKVTGNVKGGDVAREQVLGVCVRVSLTIALVGVIVRQSAFNISPAASDGHEEELIRLLNGFTLPTLEQCGVALIVAGGVTGLRLLLLSGWPQFKDATDSSNEQALIPLKSALDVILVATLPAISEEYLFRGALLPTIYPDWRGALISGCVFGSLHLTGNRNAAFAVWASIVGFAYGIAFLMTENLAVPIMAHSISNIASAVLWLKGTNVGKTST